MSDFAAVILAAVDNDDLSSEYTKPLFNLLGKPTVGYVIDACRNAGAREIVLVIGQDDKSSKSILALKSNTQFSAVVRAQEMLACKRKSFWAK